MHAVSTEVAVGFAGADDRRPLSALAVVGVWVGLSAFGWVAIAAVVSVLA